MNTSQRYRTMALPFFLGLLLGMSALLPASVFSTVGMPVKIRLLGDPRPAVTGEAFSVAIRVTVGIHADLSGFSIEDEYWKVVSFDAPSTVSLKEKESIVLNLVVTPKDARQPLVLIFEMNGNPIRKAFDLSQETFDRRMNPPPLRPEPGTDQQPFPGVDRERAQPGPAPSDKGRDSVMCQAVFDELRKIRKELEVLRSEVADTRRMVETSLGPEGPRSSDEKIHLSVGDRSVLGDRDAPVTIIEFSDYDCPYSQKFFAETFPELKKKWIDTGTVRYVVRTVPFSTRSQAKTAGVAAFCAGLQGGFWPIHELLFRSQGRFKETSWESFASKTGLKTENFTKCMADQASASRIEKEREDATTLGIKETPAFVIGRTSKEGLVEGDLIQGIKPLEYFEKKISALNPMRSTKGSRGGKN